MENQSVEIGSSLPSITNNTTGDSKSTRCKRKVIPLRVDVWSHFDQFKDKGGVWRATCKYCKAILKADPSSNGTSTLRSHVKKSCKHKPVDDLTQTLLTLVKGSENEGENKLIAVRLARFQECAAIEGIDYKASLRLDVYTRWNSTYTILDSALKFEKVFKRYDDHDPLFRLDLDKEYGFLESCDWVAARKFCTFLKQFYDLTLKIFGTKYVTSNLFCHEIVALDVTLKSWLNSNDNILTLMIEKMKEKFDKCWGNPNKMIMLTFIVVILDPYYKIGYLEFTMESLYGGGERMKQKMENVVYNLFNIIKLGLHLRGEYAEP